MDTAEWTLRFEALKDIEELLETAAPQCSPSEYFKKYILEEEDSKLAEKRLKLLENLSVTDSKEKLKLELKRLREDRNQLLKDTDWTQLADSPLSPEEKKNYRKFRTFLRDLPKNVEQQKLELKLLNYEQWKKWRQKVKHIPGFQSY